MAGAGVHQAGYRERYAGPVSRHVGRLRRVDDLPGGVQMTASVLDHVRVSEDPKEHAACEAGDAVGVHDSEGIVHLRERPYSREVVPGHPDDRGGD